MLIDELQKCIDDMQVIQQLEQASKDFQKQEKADASFAASVNENDKLVRGVDDRLKYVGYKPSAEVKGRILQALNDSLDSIKSGIFPENRGRILQNGTKSAKEVFAADWGEFYSKLSEKRISTLTTVKGITPNREKTGYAIVKIKNGATINYETSDNVRLLAVGIKEADQILEALGLNDEIMGFLGKVAENRATITDLSANLLDWIMKEKLTGKFKISFFE